MHTHTFVIVFCCLSFVACQSGSRNEGNTAGNEQKHCFLRLTGTQLQDSAYIQLVARNETVSGIYHVMPYEKDARRGTVLGTLEDNVFDLVWTFSQEGMQDTLRVVFKLQDGKLLQKPLSVDTLTGRQFTPDSSPFSDVYDRVDCVSTGEEGYVGLR